MSLDKKSKRLIILLTLIIPSIIVIIYFNSEIINYTKDNWHILFDKNEIKYFVSKQGIYAPITMIIMQCLQVIISPIPGSIITMISGALFGILNGFIYSQIGQIIGSIIVFLTSRYFFKDIVNRKIKNKKFTKFTNINSIKALAVVFFFYSVPWFPNDLMSYALGISRITFLQFLFVMAVGRIPNTLIATLQGVGIWENDWWTVVFLIILALFIILLSYLFRDKLDKWIAS